jgi:hypothetical protein
LVFRDGWDLLAPGRPGRAEQDIGPMGHRANRDVPVGPQGQSRVVLMARLRRSNVRYMGQRPNCATAAMSLTTTHDRGFVGQLLVLRPVGVVYQL